MANAEPNPPPAAHLPALGVLVAFAGLYAASILSLGHVLELPIPCGSGWGCESVAAHPSSKWLGVPIAYLGVAAYLALINFFVQATSWRLARLACLVMTAGGALSSLCLLVVSEFQVGALCPWCLVSGAAMTLLACISAALLRFEESLAPVRPSLLWGAAVVVSGGLGVQAGMMQRAANRPPIAAERLAEVPVEQFVDAAHCLGTPGAPITVVMFADLWCPACRAAYSPLIRYQRENSATVRLVWRHFPLSGARGHELSRAAAALSEIAAESGLFWEFVDAVHQQPQRFARDDYLRIMRELGFRPEVVEARLNDARDPAIARVEKDIEFADRLGVTATPTFVVILDGNPSTSAHSKTLPRILNTLEVRRLPGKNPPDRAIGDPPPGAQGFATPRPPPTASTSQRAPPFAASLEPRAACASIPAG